MNEQVCKADMGGGGAAAVDANGYPVETTGNAVLEFKFKCCGLRI